MHRFELVNTIVDELNNRIKYVPDGWYFTYEMSAEGWAIKYRDPTSSSSISLYDTINNFYYVERDLDLEIEEHAVELFIEECLISLGTKLAKIYSPVEAVLGKGE